MREEIERIAAEALNQVSTLNFELDATAPDDVCHERELEQVFREAVAALIEDKQAMKQKLRSRCAKIISDIAQLQVAMPDVTVPSLSSLEPPFKPLLHHLESQTQHFREVAHERTERKNAAVQQINEVCAEMGLSVPAFSNSLMEADVSEIEAKARIYAGRSAERKALVSRIRNEIQDMCKFLAEAPPAMPEELSDSALTALQHVHTSVERRYETRHSELTRLETQVAQVAELLDVASEISASANFKDRFNYAESRLAELNELKRQCISQVVQRARQKIMEAWDELCVDTRRRSALNGVLAQEASETVLEALEKERLELESLRQDHSRTQIVELLHEYSDLRAQEQELAEASRDPKRLAQRGFSQILKREEVTRKFLERNKPPLMLRLLPLLEQWAKDHEGESFMLGAEKVGDLVDQERTNMERRTRTSMPRKRPLSSSAPQSVQPASANAKRLKPSLSTPMLRPSIRLRPQVAPPGQPGAAHPKGTAWPPRAAASAARANSAATKCQSQRPVVSRQTGTAAALSHRSIRQTQTGTGGTSLSSHDAAARTAAIRAASQAMQVQQRRQDSEQSKPQSASRRPAAATSQWASTSRTPNSARIVPGALTGPATENQRGLKPTQARLQSQLRPNSSRHIPKRPIVQSTPVGAHTQPLAANSESAMNVANHKMAGNATKDWRAQKKLDLQENGFSYYDDSTAEVTVQAPTAAPRPPDEESFNFNHFF